MFLGMNYLLFTEIIHFSVTLLLVLWFWQRFPDMNKWLVLIVGFGFGFFIDGDHFLEYLWYLYHSGDGFSVWDFFSGIYFRLNNHVLVLFHAWEYVLLMLGFFWWKVKSGKSNVSWVNYVLLAGLCLGGHLTVDQITNGVSPWFYFISYRAIHGFGLDI